MFVCLGLFISQICNFKACAKHRLQFADFQLKDLLVVVVVVSSCLCVCVRLCLSVFACLLVVCRVFVFVVVVAHY